MDAIRLGLVGTGSVLDSYPAHGGWQRQIWGLAKELGSRGDFVTIYARHFEPDLRPPSGVHFAQIASLCHAGILDHLDFSMRVRRRLARDRLDFGLLWGERFAYLLLADTPLRKGFVVDWDAFPDASRWQIAYRPLNKVFLPVKYLAESRVRRSCEILYAINGQIKRQLEGSGHAKVESLHLGIDPLEFYSRKPEDFILFVGRLHPSKGLDTLLRSFELLSREFPELSLVLVGDGPDESRLRSLAYQLGIQERIRFMGRVTDLSKLADLYSRCSVFVLPSWFESFGIVILEALASSKPVVASDIPGPRDIIRNGTNGLLFRTGDHMDLMRKLTAILTDATLALKLGRMGKSDAETQFSFRAMGSRLLKTIQG